MAIDIDYDILVAACDYVDQQMAIMKKHASAPNLSRDEYDVLVYKCADPVQRIRNARYKAEKKKQTEAK